MIFNKINYLLIIFIILLIIEISFTFKNKENFVVSKNNLFNTNFFYISKYFENSDDNYYNIDDDVNLETQQEDKKDIKFKYDSENKLKIDDSCKFAGVGFDENHEIGECSVAIQVIPLVNNVLEIGGGAGKVSHKINSILKERNLESKHIVIEPGEEGIGNHGSNIYKNKTNFDDKYTIIKKFAEDLTYDDLKIIDGKPDCLFVDCEGCLHKFFETQIGKYCLLNARFVINEQDSHVIKKKQEDLSKVLESYNFKLYDLGYGCGEFCLTEIWLKK